MLFAGFFLSIFLDNKNISIKFWGLFIFIPVVLKMVSCIKYFPECWYQVENVPSWSLWNFQFSLFLIITSVGQTPSASVWAGSVCDVWLRQHSGWKGLWTAVKITFNGPVTQTHSR